MSGRAGVSVVILACRLGAGLAGDRREAGCWSGVGRAGAFLASNDLDRLALTLVHEASHAAPELVTKDFAYEWQRLVGFLPLEGAVKNADSYAGLIAVIMGRTVGNPVGPDTMAAEISGPERAMAVEMLGWLEHYLIRTRQEVGSLHWSMNNAIDKAQWPKGPYRDEAFPEVGKAFPEAARPAYLPAQLPPSTDQRATVAGIYDRLLELSSGLKHQRLSVTLAVDEQVAWAPGPSRPGADVALPKSFFAKPGPTRVELLLDAMLRAAGTVQPGRIAGYRRLILARGTLQGMPS
jgi:hypothetical protein